MPNVASITSLPRATPLPALPPRCGHGRAPGERRAPSAAGPAARSRPARRAGARNIPLVCSVLLAGALLAMGPAAAAQRGEASWYGGWHHGRTAANGQPFNMHAATVAHRRLSLGSKVRVCRTDHKPRCAVAEVTDRGPYTSGRILDVSRSVARHLDMLRDGTAPVRITLLSRPRD